MLPPGKLTRLYTSAMNHFLDFMGSPVRVKVPKKVLKVVKPFTPEEVAAMMRAAEGNPNRRLVARDRAIIYLLAESAGRRGEVSSVLMEDVNMETGEVIFRETKNGDDRKIYLPGTAIAALASYIEKRVPGVTPDDDRFLFTTEKGRAIEDDTVYRTVKEVAARAGIKRKAHPHLFRHTKLTQLGRTGMNQFELREFSGHKTLEMLSRYVHPMADDIKRQVQCNPLIKVESKPSHQTPIVDLEQAKSSLTMRLALGEIDQDTYNRAMDSLRAIRLEAQP